MQYIDPHLFYAYEFRKYSLEAKVIVSIGYSFRDPHTNGILQQAALSDKNKRIIAVFPDLGGIISQIESPISLCIKIEKTQKHG